jgi:hypothetical protein
MNSKGSSGSDQMMRLNWQLSMNMAGVGSWPAYQSNSDVSHPANDSSVIGKCLQRREKRNRRVQLIGLNGLGTKPMRNTIGLELIHMVRTAALRPHTACCFKFVDNRIL